MAVVRVPSMSGTLGLVGLVLLLPWPGQAVVMGPVDVPVCQGVDLQRNSVGVACASWTQTFVGAPAGQGPSLPRSAAVVLLAQTDDTSFVASQWPGDRNVVVRGLEPATGAVRWSHEVEGRPTHLLSGGFTRFVADSGAAYLATTLPTGFPGLVSRTLMKVDADGVQWRTELVPAPGWADVTYLAVVEDRVVALDQAGTMIALHARTGKPAWNATTRVEGTLGVDHATGTLYVAAPVDGTVALTSFKARSGEARWSTRLPLSVDGSHQAVQIRLAVSGDTVAVAGTQGTSSTGEDWFAVAYDRAGFHHWTWTRDWDKATDSVYGLAMDAHRLFLVGSQHNTFEGVRGSVSGAMAVLDVANGALLWDVHDPLGNAPPFSDPQPVGDGTVRVAQGGAVVEYAADSGVQTGRWHVGDLRAFSNHGSDGAFVAVASSAFLVSMPGVGDVPQQRIDVLGFDRHR